MTEALPMDVDFEFTVARLAKIANTDTSSVYGNSGTLCPSTIAKQPVTLDWLD